MIAPDPWQLVKNKCETVQGAEFRHHVRQGISREGSLLSTFVVIPG